MDTSTFGISVEISEDDHHTEALATVTVRGREFSGWGRARRNPSDPNVPLIGEELAIARALTDLSHHLVDAAAGAIEAYEGRPVDLYT